RVELAPRLLDRPGHREAARLIDHEAGRPRLTSCHNARKLLELGEALGSPVPASLGHVALHAARDLSVDQWLVHLPGLAATDAEGGHRLAAHLRGMMGPDAAAGPALTFDATATRGYEEHLWRAIASLAEGPLRNKENA